MRINRTGGMVLLCLALLSCTACGDDPSAARGQQAARGDSSTQMLAPPARLVGQDWPVFLGPQRDGSSTETGVDPELWRPHPPIVWTVPLGVSYGAPTISAGRLFQFDRFGSAERLTCFAAETGTELWRWESKVSYDDMFGYNNGPRCSPVVDGDRVYVYGVTGQLSCLGATDGRLHWSRNMNEEYGVVTNFFGVASNPSIHGELLLVMVGGSTPETRDLPTERLGMVQSDGTAVVAVDKRTGKERYRLGAGLASYASMAVHELAERPTGLAFLRDGLIGFDPTDGHQLFEFPWRADMLESVNAAMPVVDDNRVLISEAYEVGSALLEVDSSAPRADAVKVIWQDGGPRSACRFRAHWSTPVLIDGYLYGCSGRNGPDTDFRCVRFSDGEVMWTDRDRDRQRSSVLAVDSYLIVLGEYGRLELVRPNPERMEVLASAELSEVAAEDGSPLLDYPCWAAPVLSHGLLYVRGNNRLACLELIAP